MRVGNRVAFAMESDAVAAAQTWRTTHGDMTDEEWELIVDLVAPYWRPGSMGRPVKVDRRRVVDAIFYVTATGCQWRALPDSYPNWNTVHRLSLIHISPDMTAGTRT